MGKGIRVGRLFGINIHIDWTWLFIFALITWSLTTVLVQFRPDLGAGTTWGLAAIAALLFFASVLAHEMAHSLVARANGLPVRNITLFIFGGVSSIEREPDSPGSEFVMAIVGPLTSLVIGIVLLLLVGARLPDAAGMLQRPQDLFEALGLAGMLGLWLGSVNMLLGFFNMIPAFPLDGGRVLRSIFWAITKNLQRATGWASAVGQGIAWLFIIAGIAMVFGVQIPLFGTGVVNGLWLAFIGWFLNSAASRSYRQVVIQDILADVPVTEIMRRNPPVVEPDITVNTLVHEHVMGSDDYGFPVMQSDDLVGLVTMEDVRGVTRDRWDTVRVKEIMTPREDLLTVNAEGDAAQAFNTLMQRDVRQLPVLENGQLIGLLRRNDLVRWLQLQSETEG